LSTHPYIPLYVDDYDGHTAHLTLEEDGLYNRLLRLAWRTPGCSLPVDDAWIARKIRVSAEDFARVARPILDEFFKVKRGRYVQGRLKDEYDDISRRKAARKEAGKKGGTAKALKTQEIEPSNATILLEHTRAFPSPSPTVEEAKASIVGSEIATVGLFGEELVEAPAPVAKPKPWETSAAFAAFWSVLPKTMQARAGKKAKVWPEWRSAASQIGEERLLAALKRYLAEDPDYLRGTGGPGAHSWLKDGKWEHWMPSTGGQTGATAKRFPDATIRAAVHAHDPDTCVKWLDKCDWLEAERVIVPPNSFVGEQLARGAGPVLRTHNIASIRPAQRAAA